MGPPLRGEDAASRDVGCRLGRSRTACPRRAAHPAGAHGPSLSVPASPAVLAPERLLRALPRKASPPPRAPTSRLPKCRAERKPRGRRTAGPPAASLRSVGLRAAFRTRLSERRADPATGPGRAPKGRPCLPSPRGGTGLGPSGEAGRRAPGLRSRCHRLSGAQWLRDFRALQASASRRVQAPGAWLNFPLQGSVGLFECFSFF